jgi:hypothetical protein
MKYYSPQYVERIKTLIIINLLLILIGLVTPLKAQTDRGV